MNHSEASKPRLMGWTGDGSVSFFDLRTHKELAKFNLYFRGVKLSPSSTHPYVYPNYKIHSIYLTEIPNTSLVLFVRSVTPVPSTVFEVRDISEKGAKLVYSSNEELEGIYT